MPAKPQPTWVEGTVESKDKYGNPTVNGQEYRISQNTFCKSPKTCFCSDCYAAPAVGSFIRLRVNDKHYILEANEDATPSAAAAGQPALPWEAKAPTSVDPEEAVRNRRALALEQAVIVTGRGDDAAPILRLAAAFADWIETGTLPPAPAVRSITAENAAVRPARQAEQPLSTRLAEDTPPPTGEAPAASERLWTAEQVAVECKAAGIDAATVWTALGIKTRATEIVPNILTSWVNTDREHRSFAGAWQLIRKAAAE